MVGSDVTGPKRATWSRNAAKVRDGLTTAAARPMLSQAVLYDRVPYFFTDQYGLGMEYAGWAPASCDQVAFRGDPAARGFVTFWVSDGRVLAGMHVNVWDV